MQRDPTVASVLQYVCQGWLDQGDPKLTLFSAKKEDLSVHEGCILWGSRVVVPQQGQEMVLQELHEGHPGITRKKSLARMFACNGRLRRMVDIKQCVRTCHECQVNQSITTSYTNAAMEVAHTAMSQTSFGLRRSFSWENVLDSN